MQVVQSEDGQQRKYSDCGKSKNYLSAGSVMFVDLQIGIEYNRFETVLNVMYSMRSEQCTRNGSQPYSYVYKFQKLDKKNDQIQ